MMIVAGIATMPTRITQLRRAIDSLLPQVDMINVSLNKFTAVPLFLKGEHYKKVQCQITQGSDEQKFRFVAGDIYLSCDDDLEYPPNYVEVIKAKLEINDIITFHGRNFVYFPIESYYRSAKEKYRCLDTVKEDRYVEFGGTGCMAFKPSKFHVTLLDFYSEHMADIHMAIKVIKERKKILCIAHEAGWIKYQPVNDTIYDRFKNDDSEQTDRVNEAFSKVTA